LLSGANNIVDSVGFAVEGVGGGVLRVQPAKHPHTPPPSQSSYANKRLFRKKSPGR